MLRLAVDTSSKVCSVALSDEKSVFEKYELSPNSHEELLADFVKFVVSESPYQFSDIEELVVGVGPGSFTGIRISLSFMGGLKLALGKNVYGYCSLQALAASHTTASPLMAVAADARREEAFLAVYKSDSFEVLFGPEIVAADRIDACIEVIESEFSKPAATALLFSEADDLCSDFVFSRPTTELNSPAGGLLKLREAAIEEMSNTRGTGRIEPLYIRPVAAKTIQERALEKLTKDNLSTID